MIGGLPNWGAEYPEVWENLDNTSRVDPSRHQDPYHNSYLDNGYSLLSTDYRDMPGFIGIGNTSNMSIWIQGTSDPDAGLDHPEAVYTILEWCRDIALGIILAGLSLITFIGNAMVLHAVRTERRLQSVSNMFIVSLAIADLIVGLIVMPISAVYIFTLDWMFGVGICQFWIGVDYTASTASILNLFILSLDRYWSVSSPLKYIRQRTKRRALIMISLVWFASSLWLIPIIGWHYFEHDGVRTVQDDVCDTEYATNTALKIITGLLNFYLPLAVMYALYGKIFLEIKRRSKLELGQRIFGGTVDNTYVNGSLSEDSDDKEYIDSIPLRNSSRVVMPIRSVTRDATQHNGKAITGKITSILSTTSKRCGTEPATDTDQTDDELGRLRRDGYTNMTLVHVTSDNKRDVTPATDSVVTDDEDKHTQYVYDESVLESTTEHIHRYYYGQQTPPDAAANSINGPHNNNTNESQVSHARNGSNRVRFQVDPHNNGKNTAPLPKETHPAKKTYVVKPNHYRNTQITAVSEGDEAPVTLPAVSPTVFRKASGNLCSKANERHPQVRKSHSAGSASHRQSGPGNGRQHNKHGPRRQHSDPRHNRHFNGSIHRGQCPAQSSALVRQAARWRSRADNKKHRPSSALSKEIKAARQLGVIMGAFTICFLPYFVCFMVVAFCDHCVESNLMTAVTWVGYINSTLNPFLYPMCNANFRRKFREMLRFSRNLDRRRNSVYYTHSRHMSMASGYEI